MTGLVHILLLVVVITAESSLNSTYFYLMPNTAIAQKAGETPHEVFHNN